MSTNPSPVSRSVEVEGPLANFFDRVFRKNFNGGLLFAFEIDILVETLGYLAWSGWSEEGLARTEADLRTLFSQADKGAPATECRASALQYIERVRSAQKTPQFINVLLRVAEDKFYEWLGRDLAISDIAYARLAQDVVRVKIAMAALIAYYKGPLGLRCLEGSNRTAKTHLARPDYLRDLGRDPTATR